MSNETSPQAPKISSLGEIAYNTYCQHRKWKNIKGEPLPLFEGQSRDMQDAWELAASTVAKEVLERAAKKTHP